MRRLFSLFILSLFLTGCGAGFGAGQSPGEYVKRHAKFIEAEYAPYAGGGTSTICGQAFLKTLAGDVKYGAGNAVHMNPVTTYSTEWYRRLVQNYENLEQADQKIAAYHRSTIANGEGRFCFKNIPAGEYYIMCPIQWQYIGRDGLAYPARRGTGGNAYAHAVVHPQETVEVVVTIGADVIQGHSLPNSPHPPP